jgi:hypothetical protein
VVERGGQWVLTKEFAGLSADTTFSSQQEIYDKVATGLVQQYQNGALRLVS